jgi:threonine dehydrogenase-like Zn-dependent dehydrogenase
MVVFSVGCVVVVESTVPRRHAMKCSFCAKGREAMRREVDHEAQARANAACAARYNALQRNQSWAVFARSPEAQIGAVVVP